MINYSHCILTVYYILYLVSSIYAFSWTRGLSIGKKYYILALQSHASCTRHGKREHRVIQQAVFLRPVWVSAGRAAEEQTEPFQHGGKPRLHSNKESNHTNGRKKIRSVLINLRFLYITCYCFSHFYILTWLMRSHIQQILLWTKKGNELRLTFMCSIHLESC